MRVARSKPIMVGGLLGVLAILTAMMVAKGQLDQANLAARYTARVAFPLFLITYCASSLVRLWPADWSRQLLKQRRQWGLGFALAHTIHLAALTTVYWMYSEMPHLQTLLGGGLAYAIMYVMALTSNDKAMKRLGRWWKKIHGFGIHWLWFIFTFSYFGRVLDPARWEQGIIQFVLCIAALGLRIVAWRRRVIFSRAAQLV